MRPLVLALVTLVSLTGCGRALPVVQAPMAHGALAAQLREGTLLYGAYIAADVKQVVREASPDPQSAGGVILTVDVNGAQPQPAISNFHGKLVFVFNGKAAAKVKVGDRVSGFVSYVTVDMKRHTFITPSSGLGASAFELTVTHPH